MKRPSEETLHAVLTSRELPTLPLIAAQILTITAREETTLTDIAALIAQDMGLSTKILRVANSSFYSFPQQISSINQAVSILGINAVCSLVLSFSLLSMKGKKRSQRFDFEQFWERSLIGAAASRLILEQVPGADTEEAFICGLLHNIGRLLLASALPEKFDQVLQRQQNPANDLEIDDEQRERELLGVSHTEVGYAVASAWGFPESLLLPIRYHHQPQAYTGGDRRHGQNISAVHLADLLIELFFSATPELHHKQFRTRAKQLLGLKALEINRILKHLDKVVKQSAQSFGITLHSVRSVAEILQEANLRLSLLNLSYEEMNRELIKSKMALEKLTEELGQKNRLLENLANLDGLTEIYNHRYFQNFLDAEINRAIRNERTLSLLLADIDHFKKFNDTHGHQTGDFLLKEFCRVTRGIIREYDLIARYGGEEFAFVLPETGLQEALVVAEKIRKATEEHEFDNGRGTYRITISIGVASARPDGGDFAKNDFIALADEGLYEAKHAGRNRVAMVSARKKKKWFNF